MTTLTTPTESAAGSVGPGPGAAITALTISPTNAAGPTAGPMAGATAQHVAIVPGLLLSPTKAAGPAAGTINLNVVSTTGSGSGGGTIARGFIA